MTSTFSNFAMNANAGVNSPLANIAGVASGLDTNAIVNELMTINSQPQSSLQTEQAAQQARVTAYQSINSAVSAFQSAAQALDSASGWQSATATSNSSNVAATAASSAAAGSLTFTVGNLAAASSLVSGNPVSGTSAAVANPNQTFLIAQPGQIGLSSLTAGAGLPVGTHNISVSQDNSGNFIVAVDGTAETLTANPDGSVTVTDSSGNVLLNGIPAAGGLRVGTTSVAQVSTGDGTLATVAASINAAGVGVAATTVQVGSNSYRLQLTSSTTGADSSIQIDTTPFTPALGGLNTLIAGADATITVGDPAGSHYTVTSSTNSVTGLMPGVTLSLAKADAATPVTITVNQDPDALAKAVQKMIDAANTALSTIATQTAYDPTSKTAGPLLGDWTVNGLQDQILSAVSNAVAGTTLQSPGGVGIQLTDKGTITFDPAKFKAAFAANPADVMAMFQQTSPGGPGLAQRLESVGKAATDFVSGSLTLAIQGGQAEVQDLADQVAAWQPILDQERQALITQFSNMETMLAQLKGQSSSLASALGTSTTGG